MLDMKSGGEKFWRRSMTGGVIRLVLYGWDHEDPIVTSKDEGS